MDDLTLIQAYIRDINEALKDTQDEDILILFRELYEKEQTFAKRLKSTGYGRNVYQKFIKKISDSPGGIKIAKSYFRARQDSYLNTVNRGIRERNADLIYDVPVNYRFCLFAMQTLEVKDKKEENGGKVYKDKRLPGLFEEIKSLRDEIVSKHLYLSLNRAKIFKKTSYGSFTQFEDLIQMANEALVVAVDKYVMDDDSSTFHVMAIGRILSNLIENGEDASAATIGAHAKKKLYQIRKLLQGDPNLSPVALAGIMQVAEEEIVDLMGATSHQSLDDFIGDESGARMVETFTTEDNNKGNPQDIAEKSDLLSVLSKSFDVLSVMEKKVLRLKGVRFDEND
jgi:DNA-directed RNA polymerase specialized sigma subunit